MIHLLAGLVAAMILCALLAGLYDFHLLEKVITRLAMPTGMIWVGLFFAAYTAMFQGRRKLGLCLFGLWFFFWLAGSSVVSQWLLGTFENRYAHVNPTTIDPLDAVIVLGGGTSTNSDGDVWLGVAGERVNLAAALYLQGKTKQLIATGTHYKWAKSRKGEISSGTKLIWERLGIPPKAVVQLEGVNTSQEIQSIRKWMADRKIERLGLVTSATHMPRAERLARAAGLKIVPLPADFRTPLQEPLPLAMVPHSGGLFDTDTIAKELLAAIVGR